MPNGRERSAGDFITSYLEYCEPSEPPISYHTFNALALISAAAQRKCYLRWGYETLYPNIYVVLVGPSGRCKKGTSIGLAKDILEALNIPKIADNASRQAIIRTMREAETRYTDRSTGKTELQSAVVAFSNEFSVFVESQDTKFLSTMTDWYDSVNEWEYDTLGRGKEKVFGVCLTLVAATAVEWLPGMLPNEAIGGGFTARILFVVEERKAKIVPYHQTTPEQERLIKSLRLDLQIIHNLSGAFGLSDDAREYYIHWYTKQEQGMESGVFPIADARFRSYCDRRATHLRKLSMLCSLSRSNSLVIEQKDMERALGYLLMIEPNMPKAFSGVGSSRHALLLDKVTNYIYNKGRVSLSLMMQDFPGEIDSERSRIIIDTLSAQKVIQVYRDAKTQDIYFSRSGVNPAPD